MIFVRAPRFFYLVDSRISNAFYLWCCRCIRYRCLGLCWIRCVRQFNCSNTAWCNVLLWCTHIENLNGEKNQTKLGTWKFEAHIHFGFVRWIVFIALNSVYFCLFRSNYQHSCWVRVWIVCKVRIYSLLYSLNNWLQQCSRHACERWGERKGVVNVLMHHHLWTFQVISWLHFTFHASENHMEKK